MCFVINQIDGCNQLHVEFTLGIDPRSEFSTIPSATKVSEDSKLRKWTFTFNSSLNQGDTVYVFGYGNKGKLQKVSKYWWMIDGLIAGEKRKDAIFVRNTPKLPMPNRINALYETFMQGGYFATNGLLVGVARSDSPKYYGWYQTNNYSNVLKTLRVPKNSLMHTGPPHGLDHFINGKPIVKQQKSLPPTKHDNRLLASLIALKFNIVASAMGKTPRGFGELIYNDDSGNPLNGLSIKEIADYADTIITGRYDFQLGRKVFSMENVFINLDTTIQKINGAFEGTLDTISFSDSLVFKGVRKLADVPYLINNPDAIPEVIVPQFVRLYEIPSEYILHQNYPNPFNPSTTIAFDLPEPSVVTLRIYNILGEEVQTILDHVEFEEGTEEIEFNAENFASGVYFYQLVAESVNPDSPSKTFTKFKKMMIVR